MKMVALQSGSNGNCIYVEVDSVRLLFDAGISGKRAEDRLAAHGRDIRDVDALLISHEHRDHSRCMGTYQRKYGIPIHVTRKTLDAAQERQELGKIPHIRHFKSGTSLQFGAVTVETIPTPHDGVDGVAFVVDDGRHRLGILTDLGHKFSGLDAVMASLDGVLVESNYDPAMLDSSPYPEFLKQRIRGDGGHLSNIEAAELLRDSAGPGLRWACLGHLSAENNEPELALRTHRDILGNRVPLHVAGRQAATDVIEL
jgi:phosphoribosyl 1,2-cyclic phosphodiesterase